MKLPELPEGYFWRVDSDSFGFMTVAIRRRKRWGSREEERGYVIEDPPVPSAIHSAAVRALKKFNERGEKTRFLAEFRFYEGDYEGG